MAMPVQTLVEPPPSTTHRTRSWTVPATVLVPMLIFVSSSLLLLQSRISYHLRNTKLLTLPNSRVPPRVFPVRERVPTLLSVVHENEYVYALDHELYQLLQRNTTRFRLGLPHLSRDSRGPALDERHERRLLLEHPLTSATVTVHGLSCSKSKPCARRENGTVVVGRERYHDQGVVVSWTMGEDPIRGEIVTDQDLLVLHCRPKANISIDTEQMSSTEESLTDDLQRFFLSQMFTDVSNHDATISRSYEDIVANITVVANDNNATTEEDLYTSYQSPQFLDVATIAQARATSQRHHGHGRTKNQWYIPHFPIVRGYDFCRFALYQKQEMTQAPGSSSDQGFNHGINDFEPTSSTTFHLLAASNRFYLDFATTPTAIHLAYGNDETEMVVQFVTEASGTPIVEFSKVTTERNMDESDWVGDRIGHELWQASSHDRKYIHRHDGNRYEPALGEDHRSYSDKVDARRTKEMRIEGTSDTYRASDMCQAPANETAPGKFISPGMLHTVRLRELSPDTLYFYRVGLESGQGVTWSETYQFTSALPPPDRETVAKPFSYIVYGDQGCPSMGWGMGAAYTSLLMAREIELANRRNSTDVLPIREIHHIGDLSYAQGAAHIWDEWFHMIQPMTARVPLMVAVGNHEYDYDASANPGRDPSDPNATDGYHPAWGNFHNDSGGECGVPTSKRFAMPQSSKPSRSVHGHGRNVSSNGVFWFSYRSGSVHTVVISSEHDLSPSSPQFEWLRADLASVNRSLTPWLIVETHRPLYEAETKWADNGVGIAFRFFFEDLLFQYQVDIVLSGHYHSYYRTCGGLYRGVCGNSGQGNDGFIRPSSKDVSMGDDGFLRQPAVEKRPSQRRGRYTGPMHITVCTRRCRRGRV
jgi:Calcineurin-like phosphoesterase/Purple acid Phosphatase, N-terminal domain